MAENRDARAIGYVRVSTERQELGPKAQRDAIREWAKRSNVELVRFAEDLGVSGGSPIDKRPGLLDAVDALSTDNAGLLVVAKRDRLARDVVVAAMVERLAQRVGSRIVSADGGGNGADDDPGALLLRRMLDVFAEYERAIIRTRVRAALAAKKRRGEMTGKPPYGFRLAEDGKHLIPDVREQRIVEVVRARRAAGATYRSIVSELQEQGLSTRGGGRWYPAQVRRIALAEPVGDARDS